MLDTLKVISKFTIQLFLLLFPFQGQKDQLNDSLEIQGAVVELVLDMAKEQKKYGDTCSEPDSYTKV